MNPLTKSFLSILAGGSIAVTVHAQTGAAIPIFSFSGGTTNGSAPEGNMVLGPDGSFYGTTEGGGPNNYGTIFKMTTSGALTTLVNFNGINGLNPLAGLTPAPDGNFYGTTEYGGTNFGISGINAGMGGGTVFRVTTNGVLTTLATFAVTNGLSPHAPLTWGPGGLFYGTTASGGPYSAGTIFSVTTSGNLTMLTNFNNSDGADPVAGLAVGPDGYLYGTAESSGANSGGTLFRVATNGSLTILYNFGANATNGAGPQTTLALGPDGNLYGATANSGVSLVEIFPGFYYPLPSGSGTLYKISTNGTLTTVVDFDFVNGGTPLGRLTPGPDGALYSTTYNGDNGNGDNMGIVYSLTTNGVFTVLDQFNGTNGAYPIAGLTLGPDNNFYGVTSGGGTNNGNGAVYQLGLSPVFVSNPASQSVIIGNPATFSSQMFGTAPFGFQWWSNSVPVAGVTGGSLGVPHVFYSANNAQIQVVVTNTYGSATSQVANLSVVLQPNCASLANNGGGHYNVLVGSYPSSANRLWATTNLSSPWQEVAPITTDANGMGQYSDTDPADSAKYYRLSYP